MVRFIEQIFPIGCVRGIIRGDSDTDADRDILTFHLHRITGNGAANALGNLDCALWPSFGQKNNELISSVPAWQIGTAQA